MNNTFDLRIVLIGKTGAAEFDRKVSLANAEKGKLADEIKKFETEKHIAETREAETKEHISALKSELTECKQQFENRNKEKEERLEKMLHDMEKKHAEHIQMLNSKQIDDQVAQLQKQMEESETRRKQEIADLKKENEHKVQELRDSYTKQQSEVRDTVKNGVGQEENPLSQVFTGLLGTVRLFTSPSGCSVM
ncbi:unnamed protein product [Mytilus edulis]|uniref:Uncharacterized protein n=1 Tax=Mytilus edulis TaxID=6550 RepID=A0A8S3QH28_MYTED|nr:unnamed protein product [Mytilus edulis]